MGLFGIDSKKEQTTVNDQKVSLNAGGFGVSSSNINNAGGVIEYGDARIAEKALDTAKALSNTSLESTHYLLGALQAAQERGLNTVDAAVSQANAIASKATPLSAGDYAKAVSDQNTKTFIVVALIVAAVFIFKKT